MELIKELGLTVMVGVFAILGLETILHYFFDRDFTGVFQDILKKREMLQRAYGRTSHIENASNSKSGEIQRVVDVAKIQRDGLDAADETPKEHTASVVLFIVAAFTIGIIVEDISQKFADHNLPFNSLPATVTFGLVTKCGLPSEEDDRVSSLIGSMTEPKPEPFVFDLADNKAFTISDHTKVGDKVQEWIKNKQRCIPGGVGADCPTKEAVETTFKNLYYFAKNMAYSNEHHYDELRKILTRLEFMRSLYLIAWVYLVSGIYLLIIKGLLVIRLKVSKRRKDISRKGILSPHYANIISLIMVIFCVYVFSLWTFTRETNAFNRRAFGYLSSSLLEEERERKAKLPEQQGIPPLFWANDN